jgi:hypothetical protein
MEPAHAILTSSAVYLIIVIFIKARSSSTGEGELGEVRRGSRKKEKRVGRSNHTPFVPFSCSTRSRMLAHYNHRGCAVCVANFSLRKDIYSFKQKKFYCHSALAAVAEQFLFLAKLIYNKDQFT